MTTKFNYFISAITLCAIVLLNQGCSRGDVHVRKFQQGGSSNLGTSLQGRAMKGALANADCIVNDTTGTLYTSVGNSEACTDENGDFNLTLPNTPVWPVVVTIQARAGTTMKCDFPSGCGTTPFGQMMEVPTDFSLRAAAPASSTGNALSINVTPWTEAAVARALRTTNGQLTNAITDADIENALGEMAGILNNLLGLEGDENAFGTDFFTTPLSDLSDPDSSDSKQGLLLTMLSASLIGSLSSATNLTTLITQVSDSFSEDGKFNVNDTAANIQAADAVDLTSLLENLSNLADDLSSQLDSAQLETLNTVLNEGTDSSTALADFKQRTDELQAEKLAVADANDDPTQPVAVIPIADPVAAAKRYTAEMASVFNAMEAANQDVSPIRLYDIALSASGRVADFSTRALLRAADAAARMTTLSDTDISTAGCTGSRTTTLTCDLAQLVLLAEGEQVGSGSLNWVASSGQITGSGLDIGGVAINLDLTSAGAPADPAAAFEENFTVTSLSATATGVTVDLSGGTFTLTQTASGAGAWMVRSSRLSDDSGALAAPGVDFNGAIALTRSTPDTAQGGRFGLTRTSLRGEFSSDLASTIPLSLSFDVDSASAVEGTLPEDETADNFYKVENLSARLSTPVLFNKYDLQALTPDSTPTADILSIELQGDRTEYENADLSSIRIRLANSGLLLAGDGSADLTGATGDKALHLRNPNGVNMDLTANAANEVTGVISVGQDDTRTTHGNISPAGTVTFSDGTAVSIAAFVFMDNQ